MMSFCHRCVWAGSRNGRGSRLALLGKTMSASPAGTTASASPNEYLVIPVNIPPLRWPSVDHLSSSGMFILDADGVVFLRIGEAPDQRALADLFGISDVQRLPSMPVLSRMDTDLSTRVWAVIDYLQSLHEVHRPVHVITPWVREV